MSRLVNKVFTAGAIGALALVTAACGSSTTPAASGTAAPSGSSAGGTSASAGKAAALVPADLKAKGKIIVPLEPFFPPFSLNDQGSSIVGLNIDLGNALGEKLGLKVEFTPISFDAIIPGIQSKRYDVSIAAATDTPEREQQVDFVDYFKSLGTSVYVLKGNPKGIHSMADLCGKVVGSVKGTYQVGDGQAQAKECASNGKGTLDLKVFPDQSSSVLGLSSARVDAILMDTPAGNYVMTKSNGKFESAAHVQSAALKYMGMSVAKDNRGLTQALYVGLKELIDDGQYTAILKKWGQSDGAMDAPLMNGKPVEGW